MDWSQVFRGGFGKQGAGTFKRKPKRCSRPSRRSYRPTLEALEERVVLSPSLVTTPSPTTVSLGPTSNDGGKLLGNALSYAAGGNTGSTPIALLTSEDGNPADITNVESTLAAYGGFVVTDIDVEDSTPTLATLENYKAVLVWSNYSFADATQLGNVLAAYVNAGGGVVVAEGAVSTYGDGFSWALQGTWVSGGYSPYVYGPAYSTPNATLGTVELPSSPVMNGVTQFDIGPGFGSGGFAAQVSLAPGATDIADLTSGYSLAAEMTGFAGKIIGLNFFPPSSNADPASWPTTLPGPLTDAAVLSGGDNETGTITFTLTAPDGRIVDTETVPVDGDGTYSTPTGYTLPTTGQVTGTYQWNATYSGDSNNNPVSDTNNPGERVTVRSAQPTLAATPNPTTATAGQTSTPLTDSAVLSGGYYETGTITFTLTAPGGSIVDTETVTVHGDGTYTTPTGYTLPAGAAAGTYQWNASYIGDSNNNSASDSNDPHEQVTVTQLSPPTSGGDTPPVTQTGPPTTPSPTLPTAPSPAPQPAPGPISTLPGPGSLSVASGNGTLVTVARAAVDLFFSTPATSTLAASGTLQHLASPAPVSGWVGGHALETGDLSVAHSEVPFAGALDAVVGPGQQRPEIGAPVRLMVANPLQLLPESELTVRTARGVSSLFDADDNVQIAERILNGNNLEMLAAAALGERDVAGLASSSGEAGPGAVAFALSPQESAAPLGAGEGEASLLANGLTGQADVSFRPGWLVLVAGSVVGTLVPLVAWRRRGRREALGMDLSSGRGR